MALIKASFIIRCDDMHKSLVVEVRVLTHLKNALLFALRNNTLEYGNQERRQEFFQEEGSQAFFNF